MACYGPDVSFLGCFCLLCSTWPDHRDKSRPGDWLAWQEKNRVHLLGWASFRSVNQGAGNSSAVEAGREALACSHPAVLCDGSTQHREEQNSILTSILSLVLYFSLRETTTNWSVFPVLSKDNCQEAVEVPGGRGDLARRDVMAKLGKETFLALLFPGVP